MSVGDGAKAQIARLFLRKSHTERLSISRSESRNGGAEPLRVERLLQHQCSLMPAGVAAFVIARGEQERYAERHPPVGHWRHRFSSEVEVEHRGAQAAIGRRLLDQPQRFVDGGSGTQSVRMLAAYQPMPRRRRLSNFVLQGTVAEGTAGAAEPLEASGADTSGC
jgi:hypothetical protein